MAMCPLLSATSMKPGIEDERQEFIQCQEEKCQWYIRKSAKVEVYDCAITALAIYSLPHYQGDRY